MEDLVKQWIHATLERNKYALTSHKLSEEISTYLEQNIYEKFKHSYIYVDKRKKYSYGLFAVKCDLENSNTIFKGYNYFLELNLVLYFIIPDSYQLPSRQVEKLQKIKNEYINTRKILYDLSIANLESHKNLLSRITLNIPHSLINLEHIYNKIDAFITLNNSK